MRDEYIRNASKIVTDPNILINLVSHRVKQLNRGSRPLVESLEKLSAADCALREIAEGRITYKLPTHEEVTRGKKATQVVYEPATLPRTSVEKNYGQHKHSAGR